MSKFIKIGLVIVVLVIVYRLFAGTYNKLVVREEQVASQWAQVENVYQRRADLIPNLVNTVKGYADFEQETLTGVIEARAKATSINVDASNLSPQQIEQFQQAQGQLSTALGRLLVAVERYPDLKANQNFLDLQTQLEGTENRITVERQKFNDTVREYNTYLRGFPRNVLAGMYGFEQKGYFAATEGSDRPPVVEF